MAFAGDWRERQIQTGTQRARILLAATSQMVFASVRLLFRVIWLGGQVVWVALFTVPVMVIFWVNALPGMHIWIAAVSVLMLIGLLSMAYWSSHGIREKPPSTIEGSTKRRFFVAERRAK